MSKIVGKGWENQIFRFRNLWWQILRAALPLRLNQTFIETNLSSHRLSTIKSQKVYWSARIVLYIQLKIGTSNWSFSVFCSFKWRVNWNESSELNFPYWHKQCGTFNYLVNGWDVKKEFIQNLHGTCNVPLDQRLQ